MVNFDHFFYSFNAAPSSFKLLFINRDPVKSLGVIPFNTENVPQDVRILFVRLHPQSDNFQLD